MPGVNASTHGSIIIRGARENNLKDVSLDIPKGAITVFTGVSGSGKSSIVFDTIAAESQRLLNDTMPAFVQQFLPHYGQPDADVIDELTAAIIVDQQRIGGNARSTVGHVHRRLHDAADPLLARRRRRAPGPSSRYSFNDPTGMCLECEGLGRVAAVDEDALVDPDKSLAEGAIDFPNFQRRLLVLEHLRRVRLLRREHEDPRLHARAARPAPARARGREDQGRRRRARSRSTSSTRA